MSEILILDEALANLDQQNAQKIEQLFLKQPDLTYLTITHHLTSERAAYFDEVVRLEAWKRINCGKMAIEMRDDG